MIILAMDSLLERYNILSVFIWPDEELDYKVVIKLKSQSIKLT
jgi:hypothetical protein